MVDDKVPVIDDKAPVVDDKVPVFDMTRTWIKFQW